MLETKTYELQEFKKLLKIPENTWKRKKTQLLDHLNLYFDYDLLEAPGKPSYIRVNEQFAEYEPLPRQKKSDEIKQFYMDETRRIVKKEKWNTGSNIARNIIADGHNKYDHAEGTISNYVRPLVKDNFVQPLNDEQWMRATDDKLSYVPLTEEELEYWLKLLGSDSTLEQYNVIARYFSGYLSKKEARDIIFDQIIGGYGAKLDAFKQKYGYVPIKVKELIEKAF